MSIAAGATAAESEPFAALAAALAHVAALAAAAGLTAALAAGVAAALLASPPSSPRCPPPAAAVLDLLHGPGARCVCSSWPFWRRWPHMQGGFGLSLSACPWASRPLSLRGRVHWYARQRPLDVGGQGLLPAVMR